MAENQGRGVREFSLASRLRSILHRAIRLQEVLAYIANQPERHRRRTFDEELRALLKLYELEFDECHLWD
jgi:hypothetical protein